MCAHEKALCRNGEDGSAAAPRKTVGHFEAFQSAKEEQIRLLLERVDHLKGERRDAYCRPLLQEDEDCRSVTSSLVDRLVGETESEFEEEDDASEHAPNPEPPRCNAFTEDKTTQTSAKPTSPDEPTELDEGLPPPVATSEEDFQMRGTDRGTPELQLGTDSTLEPMPSPWNRSIRGTPTPPDESFLDAMAEL